MVMYAADVVWRYQRIFKSFFGLRCEMTKPRIWVASGAEVQRTLMLPGEIFFPKSTLMNFSAGCKV
jgi:hypothetical protein